MGKKTKMRVIATFCLLLLGSCPAMADLGVTTSTSGSTLASTILGSGISLVSGSVLYTGATYQAGTFQNGLSAGIGIQSGIILTTGDARLAPGPNNEDGAGATTYTGSDSVLGGNDKNVLEFDFLTQGGDLFFNYVFASEEYNEYTNSQYNDAFGFFLDGVNIALIPGTSTPVSINNVNGGNPLGINASNAAYYNNNDPSNGIPTPYNIQYDGFTDVFTAKALNIGAGTHHIKLAIVDRGDTVLDSAVFIQANTFSDIETPVPEPTSLLLLGLQGLAVLAGMTLYGRYNKS